MKLQNLITPEKALIGFLLASSFVYCLMLPQNYVGFFNDDAMYILATKSLLQGRYVALELPGQPFLNYPLPGFPLFLAPFVKLATPHWHFLKIVTLLLTLLSASLLWIILKLWLRPWPRVGVISLFLLNPLTLLSSTNIMSEPCFLFGILISFIGLSRTLSSISPIPALQTWAVGLAIAWTSLIRPQGFILIPFVLAGLGYQKKWRLAIPLAGPALFFWIALLARNYILTHTLNAYLSRWLMRVPLQSPAVVLSNLGQWFQSLCIKAFFGFFSLSSGVQSRIVQGFGILVLLGLMITGFIGLSREKNLPHGYLLAFGGFLMAYFLGHVLWVAIDPHYLLPLMPFIFALTFKGLHDIFPKGHRHCAILAAYLMMLSLFLIEDKVIVSGIVSPPYNRRTQLPDETLRWIKEKLPENQPLFSNKPKMVYLYTGHQAMGPAHFHDQEEFRYWLLKSDVHFLALFPQIYLSEEWTAWWERFHLWVLSSPDAYPPIYGNATEQTNIFAVQRDDRFMKAWELYVVGRTQIESGSSDRALNTLNEAIKYDPNLVQALNAYGATCLLLNRNLKQGERCVREALRIQPCFPLATRNLERYQVLKKSGRYKS